MHEYGDEYARKYIERTLSSPYTEYKNAIIASIAADLKVPSILDLGGNVSGLMKIKGSLRFQLEKVGISYYGLDLLPAYFSPTFALALGQNPKVIYDISSGIVGDICMLPIETAESDGGGIGGIVCADVIEHVKSPEVAMAELFRVLKLNGKLIIVVPSLYKLDAIKVPHILQKRYSSHENRLLVSEWVDLLKTAGFSVNRHHSRPLAIASGLLYLTWLNPAYVPTKTDAGSPEEFSPQAEAFKKVKDLIGRCDDKIDDLVLKNRHGLDSCRKKFKNGDILGLLELVKTWYFQVTGQQNHLLNKFVADFDFGAVSLDALYALCADVSSGDAAIRDNAFFGNSALLVLEK